MKFFESKKKNSTLLIDIGSTSVAAALTHNEQSKNPIIDISIRLSFSNSSEQASDSIENRMLLTLNEVMSLIFQNSIKNSNKNKFKEINTVLVGFSSLWYTSKLETKNIQSKGKIKLNVKKINELLEHEKKQFNEELKNIYIEGGDIFEGDILGVSANGYRIENWINKEAESFDLTYLLSAAPDKLLRKIEDRIIGIFGTRRGISFNSINSLLSKLISRSFRNIHSALLVDLSGDTTNLLFIQDGIPSSNKHLSFGVSSLVNNISENLLIPLPVAQSALSLYNKGVLNDESMKELEKVFSESEDEWSIHGAMLQKDGTFTSPQSIFLVSDTPYAVIGMAILKDLFPDKEIIILDCQNGFLKECIKSEASNEVDGHLAVLGTYSQYLY